MIPVISNTVLSDEACWCLDPGLQLDWSDSWRTLDKILAGDGYNTVWYRNILDEDSKNIPHKMTERKTEDQQSTSWGVHHHTHRIGQWCMTKASWDILHDQWKSLKKACPRTSWTPVGLRQAKVYQLCQKQTRKSPNARIELLIQLPPDWYY